MVTRGAGLSDGEEEVVRVPVGVGCPTGAVVVGADDGDADAQTCASVRSAGGAGVPFAVVYDQPSSTPLTAAVS